VYIDGLLAGGRGPLAADEELVADEHSGLLVKGAILYILRWHRTGHGDKAWRAPPAQ
jgi:hypothetical protein